MPDTAVGPWGVPFLGYAPFLIGGCIHEKLDRLKEKYGDIFCLNLAGKDVVIMSEWRLIRDAFNRHELNDRADLLMFRQFSDGNHGILGSCGNQWRENRRFTISVLRDFGLSKAPKLNAMIQQEVLKLCDLLRRNEDPQDFQHPLNLAILNLIWKLTAGKFIRKQFEHGDLQLDGLLDLVSKVKDDAVSLGLLQILPGLLHVWPLKEVEERKKFVTREPPKDYIEAYFQKMDEFKQKGESNPYFTELQLWVTVAELFIAGSETTSSAVRWFVLFLLRHPNMQEKIQSEVDRVVGKERIPSLDDRNQYWKTPNEFIPERFLDEDGNVMSNLPSLVPFGTGRRQCIGESLAKMELFLFVATFMQKFTFCVPQGYPIPSAEADGSFVITSPKPYKFLIRERLHT
ncbi:unnamed protein product [Darwinula stevensoni]|uniref:Cytochrome P450 n=1 Tax=Darwinula stevensoni TaxID=69355 RepID=A0A7R9A6Y2_9CRUS|nr:unnamed protein product [Darwinula stevensoni]CAG0896003.1 unnamed protein product [Darwinula stevensoni]